MLTLDRKIPTTMVSQHPDHAQQPYWLSQAFIKTEHESKEAFLSFSDLGVNEYKWDWEGKLVDESVIERLFTEHLDYFREHPLGKEKFLTFRLPNPSVETEFRLGRAFMGILSAAALAKQIGFEQSPIFEVILPMTETATEMIDIQEAFREMARLRHPLFRFDYALMKHIQLIPLFEEVNVMMSSDQILEKYIELHHWRFGFTPSYLRPYIARSDPALNSGLVATILAIKVTLSHYAEFAAQKKIQLFPILGSASLPFRGGLTPDTVADFAAEYRGIRTALLQSAFRYDYPKSSVLAAIQQLDELLPIGETQMVTTSEEKRLRDLIRFFEAAYKETIEHIAEPINVIAGQLPKRRERVQHIGLFGYSRGVGSVKLPRAIGFTAALYSLGVPPEFIGTGRGLHHAQKEKQLALIEKFYRNLRSDMIRAGRYLNKSVLAQLAKDDPAWQEVQKDIQYVEKYLGQELGPKSASEKQHAAITERIYQTLQKKQSVTDFVEEAAQLRQSMG